MSFLASFFGTAWRWFVGTLAVLAVLGFMALVFLSG